MRIGVIGGGQLGRMLALAAYPLGARVTFLDPVPDAPMRHLAEHICATYDDERALAQLARDCEVVTYEFENVPVASALHLSQFTRVYPPPAALRVSQDRWEEKSFFNGLGIPTSKFARVDTHSEFLEALENIGLPAVLKTRRLGYDGKGQFVIQTRADAAAAWRALGGAPLILEARVNFTRELSILAVRGQDGACAFYPLVENVHRDGILRWSRTPISNAENLEPQAQEYARRVLEALRYVGVLAIEMFQTSESLLANEMAPRVHNSGHWTIEGAVTSQFENHVRAISAMPLGSPRPRGYSALLNFIGALPDVNALLQIPDAHAHVYDKAPRAGRKLGHVTIVAEDEKMREMKLAEALELERIPL